MAESLEKTNGRHYLWTVNEQQHHTTMSRTAKAKVLFASEVFGTAAFHAGIKSAPCLDRQFMVYMIEQSGNQVMNPISIPMMKAWAKGWHAANLNAATV